MFEEKHEFKRSPLPSLSVTRLHKVISRSLAQYIVNTVYCLPAVQGKGCIMPWEVWESLEKVDSLSWWGAKYM